MSLVWNSKVVLVLNLVLVVKSKAPYYFVQGGSNFKISLNETLVCDHWDESYWAVLSCGTVYYFVQGGSNLKVSLNETLVCDHSNESYWAVLSCGTVYYAVQGGSNF